MTTTQLPSSELDEFDYLIVGGGTAGCVIASRLSEYLPRNKILLIEAGPSDYMNDKVLNLKDWLNLLGSELDYDYGTTDQPNGWWSTFPSDTQRMPNATLPKRSTLSVDEPRVPSLYCTERSVEIYHRARRTAESDDGNSHIRHSRAKVLGGCSSHNTLISFRPFEYDCKVWESLGCRGWSFQTFMRVLDSLRNTVQPVHERHRNQLCKDWITSCSTAMEIPIIHDFNDEIRRTGGLRPSVGFFSVSYNPDDGRRSSASVAYIHPILRGEENRPNLTILTDAWVSQINVQDDRVAGVSLTLQSGDKLTLRAKNETILCAGAVDTPRLMLLSGLGPKQQLEDLSIPVVKNILGVGENLLDHPESIIIWELNKPVPPNQTTMDSDAGIFLRREIPGAHGLDGDVADIMMHCYQIPFCLNTARLGYDTPIDAFCMTPNIPRPRSKGRIYLTSSNPQDKPALDFRYFTDPEGYDAATIVAGLKAARRVAMEEPFKSWIKREVAPGPNVNTDEELSEYGRRVAHTVYHPAGTTKMGDPRNDPLVVVDSSLRVVGLKGVRIADAGIFPAMPSINPMLTVLAIGERAAEMIAEDAGWRGNEKPKL